MTDNVNHPKHYNAGKIEVIEFIEDQSLTYHLGSAIKYICRAGKKDPAKYVEDLEKAIWYIRRRIELCQPEPRRPNDMKVMSPEKCDHSGIGLPGCSLCDPMAREHRKEECRHDTTTLASGKPQCADCGADLVL